MESEFSMVAKTFQGLEDVLCEELISIGAKNVEIGTRMVSFEGDLEVMYKANLCCRTALRILKPIEKFTAYNPDELYDFVREIDWEKYMTVDSTFSIDSTVNSSDFTHSKYVTYRVKDGIADHFNDKYGRRPSIRLTGADLQLNVHISEDRVTISLDSSGEPLNKRGYRVEQTGAPINEVLAAGIIMKSGWRGDCDFADPMCGSGTFLIEAAMIACNINPGIYRESFAFEKWPDFDKELFENLYNDDSEEKEFAYKIHGGDIDPEAVGIARKNIRAAKFDDMIELTCRPMSDWEDNAAEGVLVMNPPYGERLKPEDMTALYKSIGTCLKQNFKGWHAWIIGYKDEHFSDIGLKPSMKYPLNNGGLECSVREYVMFDGSYSGFRADGGSLGKDIDDARGPRKMRRLSDDEWRSETEKFGGHKKGDKKNDKGGRKNFDRPKGNHTSKGKKDSFHNSRDFDDADMDNEFSFHKKESVKPRGFDNDRGGFKKDRGGFGGERGGFKKDRGGFGGDRGGFKKDRPGFGGDKGGFKKDRNGYGNERGGFRKDRDDFRGGYSSRPRTIVDKGPSLPEESATVVSPVKMRPRKGGWQKKNNEDTE